MEAQENYNGYDPFEHKSAERTAWYYQGEYFGMERVHMLANIVLFLLYLLYLLCYFLLHLSCICIAWLVGVVLKNYSNYTKKQWRHWFRR